MTSQLNSNLTGLEVSSSLCSLTSPSRYAMHYRRVLAVELSHQYIYTSHMYYCTQLCWKCHMAILYGWGHSMLISHIGGPHTIYKWINGVIFAIGHTMAPPKRKAVLNFALILRRWGSQLKLLGYSVTRLPITNNLHWHHSQAFVQGIHILYHCHSVLYFSWLHIQLLLLLQ